MAATHIRYTADVPLTKERKFGAVHKALLDAQKAWEAAVAAEGGTLEYDAVTIPKRKPVAEVPASLPAPRIDLADFAAMGAQVDAAAGAATISSAASPAPVRGRAA